MRSDDWGYPVALRAVWLLHLRGWWSKLEALGLDRSVHLQFFEDYEAVVGPEPLSGGYTVLHFNISVPGAYEAAEKLIQLKKEGVTL